MRGALLPLAVAIAMFSFVGSHWNGVKPWFTSVWGYFQDDTGSWGNGADIPVKLQGEAAVLKDAKTGKVLFAKNADERLYPASTTKIMTALIALEIGKLEDQITVGDEVGLRTPEESSASLAKGDRLSLRDLLAAMMLPSGNDAARTVARYVVRKESGKDVSAKEAIRLFAGMMNEKARDIGASHSHFVNPHGLHDPQHYTTAGDMALIAEKAMNIETFRLIVSEPAHIAAAASASPTTYVNRNLLLQPGGDYFFQGANGVKTGFTDEAGYCLVSSAKRDDKSLIAVVLHSTATGVWTDSQLLLQFGFDKTDFRLTGYEWK